MFLFGETQIQQVSMVHITWSTSPAKTILSDSAHPGGTVWPLVWLPFTRPQHSHKPWLIGQCGSRTGNSRRSAYSIALHTRLSGVRVTRVVQGSDLRALSVASRTFPNIQGTATAGVHGVPLFPRHVCPLPFVALHGEVDGVSLSG